MANNSVNRQLGFNTTVVIMAVLVIALVGLAGWGVYSFYGKPSATASTNKTTDNNQNSGNTAAQQQTDPNARYVIIKEWGVRFKANEGLGEVMYFTPGDINLRKEEEVFKFSIRELADKEPNCREGGTALFSIKRSTLSPEQYADIAQQMGGGYYGTLLVNIGKYYYYYLGSQSTCSLNEKNYGLEEQQRDILGKSIKSLEAAL